MTRASRLTLTVVAVAVALGAVGLLLRPGTQDFKIGVILPMTGSGAVWGANARKGIDLALEEINAAGGVHGRRVSLVFDDTRSVPRDAISAFRRVVDLAGVKLVVVDMISSDVLAVAPLAEQAKVVIISPGASNPGITQAGDFVFRNWPSDAMQGELDAQYAYQVLGWRRAAILAIRNDYGQALTDIFRRTFEGLGGRVAFVDAFAQGESNFRSLITRLRAISFDGIFLPAYPQEIPILVRQLREMRVGAPLLGTESFQDPVVVSGAGPAIEGAVYSIPRSPDTSSAAVSRFLAGFQRRFRESPGVPADVAYDALNILVSAANSVPRADGDSLAIAVKNQLYELRGYDGASGGTTFDRNGDAVKPFEFRVIRGGQFVRAEQQLTEGR